MMGVSDNVLQNFFTNLEIVEGRFVYFFLITYGEAARDRRIQLKSLKLAKLMKKDSEQLLKTYAFKQGDIYRICTLVQLKVVPDVGITGKEPVERMQSIYTSLIHFKGLFDTISEQQRDLLYPADDTLHSMLIEAQSRIKDLANNLLMTFPKLSVVKGQESSPLANGNYFQQKLFGCSVLKKYTEFLSQVVKELSDFGTKTPE
ncbi:IL-6 subfamily cytokine M17 [Lepisosteus oculatus]